MSVALTVNDERALVDLVHRHVLHQRSPLASSRTLLRTAPLAAGVVTDDHVTTDVDGVVVPSKAKRTETESAAGCPA